MASVHDLQMICQSQESSEDSANKDLRDSIIVLLNLSDNPFCWGG